jgi:glycosyltransferase involved in cell wall biosynthesis
MNILIFYQHYLKKGDAGMSRFNQLVKYWSKKGHKITIITSTARSHFLREQKDNKKITSVENEGSQIKVIREYIPSSYNKNFRGRMFGYISYSFLGMISGLFSGKQDVIVASSPPLFVGIPAFIVSRAKRIPFVFEVRDLWPKFAVDTGVLKNKFFIKIAYKLEKFIYKKANLINVLTPAFKDYLIKEKGIKEEKIAYIPNGADLDLMKPEDKNNWVRGKYGWGDKFVILYVGAHGLANDLQKLIETAKLLRENKSVLFALVGDGMKKNELQKEASKSNLKNIIFIDPVPKSEISDFINASDVCTAILKPCFTTTYPNKIFDYMACSKPILLTIDGISRDLVVNKAKSGLFADPRNPEEIKKNILIFKNNKELVKRKGENGYNFVRKNFSRSKLSDDYLLILKDLQEGKKIPCK